MTQEEFLHVCEQKAQQTANELARLNLQHSLRDISNGTYVDEYSAALIELGLDVINAWEKRFGVKVT